MEGFAPWIAGLEASSFAVWARGSSYAYPIANLVHLAGLILLVGGIGLLDLRLAGAFRAIPLIPLSRVLTTSGLIGLAILIPSGLTMYAADAKALSASDTFRLKLILIGVALVNAAAHRAAWGDQLKDWDERAPPVARLMALVSLSLWVAVAVLGRLIAYR